jgi:ParB-like chromosome segregation protein Spo0J
MRFYHQANRIEPPASADIGATALPSPTPETTVQNIALDRLSLAPGSRRKVSPRSIHALADRIYSGGQFQSLMVVPSEDSKYCVVAGDRRFAALRLLAKQGRISATFAVPCRVINAKPVTETDAFNAAHTATDNFGPDERRRRFGDLLNQCPGLVTGSELAARRS